MYVAEPYINIPGLGLGFIKEKRKDTVKIAIVSTGGFLSMPTSDIHTYKIPQTIHIDQVGDVKLYEYIKVTTSKEMYILQLIKIQDAEGCTFVKYWRDSRTGNLRNGILVLDSNDFFTASKQVIRIKKLHCLPKWLGLPRNPLRIFKSRRSQILNTKK